MRVTAAVAATDSYAKRDQAVLEHLPLVKAMAANLHQHLPANVDRDDLVHAGILGLFAAIDCFSPEKNVPFASYAKHRIRGAMLDSLRKLDWASRELRHRQREVSEARCELATALQRTPAAEEIAGKLGINLSAWHKLNLALRNAEVVSITMPSGEDGVQLDLPCKPEIHPDAMCGRRELSSTLHSVMQRIPANYRTVLRLYYGQDMTMRDIGVKLHLNESRISQIHKAALRKMRQALETIGVESAGAF